MPPNTYATETFLALSAKKPVCALCSAVASEPEIVVVLVSPKPETVFVSKITPEFLPARLLPASASVPFGASAPFAITTVFALSLYPPSLLVRYFAISFDVS